MDRKLTFEQWMAIVASIMSRLCEMGPDDLPDWGYRAAYDEGKSPDCAARAAIKAARNY
jgi:hypothetical protein